jgi:hypothetical protein
MLPMRHDRDRTPGCICRRDLLCNACLERDFRLRSGCAIARGQKWAQSVAELLILEILEKRTWPSYADKAASIARRKVAGLSRDQRLQERFARLCHEHAGLWWSRLSAGPADGT